MISGMIGKILSLVAAEPGWRAIYLGDDEERELTRIVSWALVEDADGTQRMVGLVVDASDPTQIVAAADGASATAPHLDRYGFKDH
jgi:NAD(P)-dependent dehydrogenase (short-subunit alcohol dehydrogenase family)